MRRNRRAAQAWEKRRNWKLWEGAPVLDLVDKDFKSAITNMFKELKEHLFKELKEV